MKIFLTFCFLFLIDTCGSAQAINFDSYEKITDGDFKKFVHRFDKASLPFTTSILLKNNDIWALTKEPLQQHEVNKFLVKKATKELITGPLYIEAQEDNLPDKVIMGEFVPMYKLPTNGNYVLLVVAQVDTSTNRDCLGRVVTISFDLRGNYLYLANYTYRPGTENVDAGIDAELRSYIKYVVNSVDGKMQFPSTEKAFEAELGHLVHQVNSNGKATKISFSKTKAKFEFSPRECRFKEIE